MMCGTSQFSLLLGSWWTTELWDRAAGSQLSEEKEEGKRNEADQDLVWNILYEPFV
jgi:hypothetical protein